jgi:hypothetical protein
MKKLVVIIALSLSTLGCDKDDGVEAEGNWLIPLGAIQDGGPGKDGIPALENPEKTSETNFLVDSELVIGYYDGNNAVAYPHQILDWHEIINDELNGFPYAIVYCPLTGTGIGWDRTLNGNITTFGVSGLLYNNNLIPYDRGTGSNWSQMRNDCVNGELEGEEVVTFQVVETTWGTWKSMYPDSKVVSQNTGFSRSYGVYPYGSYRTNNNLLTFPLTYEDNRLPRKDRVHGVIINRNVKVYEFKSFDESNKLIMDNIAGSDIIIVGNATNNLIVSFYAALPDGTTPEFSTINEGRAILQDEENNKWDVFGYAVEGPRTGERLVPTKSYMGYWFAWGTFYPSSVIYE